MISEIIQNNNGDTIFFLTDGMPSNDSTFSIEKKRETVKKERETGQEKDKELTFLRHII